MATTVNLRKLLHGKAWEQKTVSPAVTNAGSFIVSDKYNLIPNSLAFYVAGASAIWRYDGDEDAWLQLPNSGIAGTYAAGACGEFRALGAMGGTFNQTATAGGATSITTNKTIVKNLAGHRLRVIAGTGVGFDGTIVSNTIGANSVITTSGGTFDATTVFQVFSGSLWFMNAGTVAVGFSVYDLATNVWTARSVAGLPTAWGTDARLVSTIGSAGVFLTQTATAGGATTLTDGAESWLTNQWANYQIRITAGTGVGQIRTIASNTGTVITVSAAWAVNPDATSVYAIEGNGDFMYLLGNNAIAMYRYTVSTNTWATLSPTAARVGAAATGLSANWIDSVEGWNLQANGSPLALTQGSSIYRQNGRYIFSFRGGASNILDVYDIAANTWISGVAYGNQFETFGAGSSDIDFNGDIYINKEGTGRIFRFSVKEFNMKSFSQHVFPQGAAVAGVRMCLLPYEDGATKINFVYCQGHSINTFLRIMVI
jgi:hypothetical protein